MSVEFLIQSNETLKKLEEIAKEYFKHSPPTHDWQHTMRVAATCKKLGNEESADLNILIAAAMLHDIGREEADKNGTCHAELSARMAVDILNSLSFPEAGINDVVHCISTHRFRGDNLPQTIEAKVLYDADKLDAIGAIGVCRAFSYAGENHQPLYSSFDQEHELKKVVNHSEHSPVVEFNVKLKKIKDKMLTKSGKRMAEERHNYMSAFFETLKKEIEGHI